MLAAFVDSAAGQSLSADGGVRDHTLDSQHHGLFRVLFHQLVIADGFHAADPAGVMIVNLLGQLLAGEEIGTLFKAHKTTHFHLKNYLDR